MKLGDHKRQKLTEHDFFGKIPFAQIWAKSVQNRPKMDLMVRKNLVLKTKGTKGKSGRGRSDNWVQNALYLKFG